MSRWEIAITTRLGKLAPGIPLPSLACFIEAAGLPILPIGRDHAVADVSLEPATREPFDRFLPAERRVEKRCLVSAEGVLVGHPLVATKL